MASPIIRLAADQFIDVRLHGATAENLNFDRNEVKPCLVIESATEFKMGLQTLRFNIILVEATDFETET